jgi:hypothetical protein
MIGYVYGPYRGNKRTQRSGEAIFLLLSDLERHRGNTGHAPLRWGGNGTQSDGTARQRTCGAAASRLAGTEDPLECPGHLGGQP